MLADSTLFVLRMRSMLTQVTHYATYSSLTCSDEGYFTSKTNPTIRGSPLVSAKDTIHEDLIPRSKSLTFGTRTQLVIGKIATNDR